MFLMMCFFLNEKINKNDLTRKKQTELDYKINTGSKSKPPFSHSPKPHLILRCTREREGGLALDAAAMPPPFAENGDLLPHASSRQQPRPQWHPPSRCLHSLAGPSSSYLRPTHLSYYAFSSLQPS